MTANGVTTYPHMAAPMAAVHTIFNVITTLFFLPFSRQFAHFVSRVIKAIPTEKPHLSALKMHSYISPVIACDQALLEVGFMRDSNLELLACVKDVLTGEAADSAEKHILHREEVLDNVQREITEFLGKIIVKRAPTEVSDRVRRLLRLSDELESVSDEAAAILKATRRLRKGGQNLSAQSCQALLGVHEIVFSLAETVSGLIKSPRPRFDLAVLQANSHDIGRRIHNARRKQLDRVGPDDPDSPVRVLAELDILNAYERIRACYINMAETLAGHK